MIIDNIVIVLNNSNYIEEYREECPFKAQVIDKDDLTITVRGLKSKKEYELYHHQILESLSTKEIKELLSLK